MDAASRGASGRSSVTRTCTRSTKATCPPAAEPVAHCATCEHYEQWHSCEAGDRARPAKAADEACELYAEAPSSRRATNARPPMTSQQALRQLLSDHPERIVTHREVCERLGHRVARVSLSSSAAKIPRSECIAAYGCKGGYAAPAIARPPLAARLPAPPPTPSAQSVLAELLAERPGQIITRADVCARLGRASAAPPSAR